jgi:toxin HigB-1
LTLLTPRGTIEAWEVRVIRSFHDRDTELIWRGERSRRLPPDIQEVARRKLRMLNAAQSLADLRAPPANRLEALRGDREGRHSIRINDRWRICFRWEEQDAHEVEIVDYH